MKLSEKNKTEMEQVFTTLKVYFIKLHDELEVYHKVMWDHFERSYSYLPRHERQMYTNEANAVKIAFQALYVKSKSLLSKTETERRQTVGSRPGEADLNRATTEEAARRNSAPYGTER